MTVVNIKQNEVYKAAGMAHKKFPSLLFGLGITVPTTDNSKLLMI